MEQWTSLNLTVCGIKKVRSTREIEDEELELNIFYVVEDIFYTLYAVPPKC